MIERLMNVTVTSAQKKTDGESKHGPWVIYDFKIDEPNWEDIWFGYLTNPDKIIPAVGMKIDVIEYEIEEKGEYTNYKVKKLMVPEGEAPTSNPKPKPKQAAGGPKQAPQSTNGGQAYINHGEVVCKLMGMAGAGEPNFNKHDYGRLLNAFLFGIRVLTGETAPPKPVEKQKPSDNDYPQDPEPEEIPEDDIPF